MRRRYPCLDGGLPRPLRLLRCRHSVTRAGSEHYDAHFSQAVRVARLVVGVARIYLWRSVFFASRPRMHWLAHQQGSWPKVKQLERLHPGQTNIGWLHVSVRNLTRVWTKDGIHFQRLWLWLLNMVCSVGPPSLSKERAAWAGVTGMSRSFSMCSPAIMRRNPPSANNNKAQAWNFSLLRLSPT